MKTWRLQMVPWYSKSAPGKLFDFLTNLKPMEPPDCKIFPLPFGCRKIILLNFLKKMAIGSMNLWISPSKNIFFSVPKKITFVKLTLTPFGFVHAFGFAERNPHQTFRFRRINPPSRNLNLGQQVPVLQVFPSLPGGLDGFQVTQTAQLFETGEISPPVKSPNR